MSKPGAVSVAKGGASAEATPLFKNEAFTLAFCVVGVVGSLLMYGVLQVKRTAGANRLVPPSNAMLKCKHCAGTHHDHPLRCWRQSRGV